MYENHQPSVDSYRDSLYMGDRTTYHTYYAGWWFSEHEFYDFPYIGNAIIPTIFQRGRYTTNQ